MGVCSWKEGQRVGVRLDCRKCVCVWGGGGEGVKE